MSFGRLEEGHTFTSESKIYVFGMAYSFLDYMCNLS